MPFNLVLIGPPGVGKGTQAAMLSQRLGLVHLASGNLFREEIAAATDLGKTAKEYIKNGKLVPDEVTIQMMEEHIIAQDARTSGFVLDGFPRTVAQARALDEKLDAQGVSIARVASLEIDDEVVVSRITGRRLCPSCGELYHVFSRPPVIPGVCNRCGDCLTTRADDNEATIRQRLKVFHDQTTPVLAYYEEIGRLHRIDSNRLAEEVYQDIVKGLRV